MVQKKEYKYLTYEERQEIEEMIKNGLSASQIAKQVGKSRPGIYYELKKGGWVPGGKYSAEEAQRNLNHCVQNE